MKNLIRLEELAQMLLAIAGLYFQSIHFPFWLWPVLFLSPDIGMLGYLINPSFGAFTYNLFHHKGLALVLLVIGYYCIIPSLELIGLLIYGHAAFDRIWGYGLKFGDNFKHTHLGWLPAGKSKILR